MYHLAGWSDVGASWAEPLAAFRVNADGTLNVLQAARDAGVARVLVGQQRRRLRQGGARRPPARPRTRPLRPVTPYAASKVAADFLGLQACLGYGLEVLRVRAFNHLGPGQSNRFVAPAIAERIAANEHDGGEVVPVGNLSARRDFTDVRDVVRAYRLLDRARRGRRGLQRLLGPRPGHQELADRLLALATARCGSRTTRPCTPGRRPGAAGRPRPS